METTQLIKNTGLVDQRCRAVYILNTTDGPVIRVWLPFRGWHFLKAMPTEDNPEVKPGAACSPLTIVEIARKVWPLT